MLCDTLQAKNQFSITFSLGKYLRCFKYSQCTASKTQVQAWNRTGSIYKLRSQSSRALVLWTHLWSTLTPRTTNRTSPPKPAQRLTCYYVSVRNAGCWQACDHDLIKIIMRLFRIAGRPEKPRDHVKVFTFNNFLFSSWNIKYLMCVYHWDSLTLEDKLLTRR